MVDCGFGLKETIDRLERYQINPSKITAILLTHEHEDHIKGAFSLANKFQIPIYLSHGTYQMSHKKNNDGYKIRFELINNFDSFMIDDISISGEVFRHSSTRYMDRYRRNPPKPHNNGHSSRKPRMYSDSSTPCLRVQPPSPDKRCVKHWSRN